MKPLPNMPFEQNHYYPFGLTMAGISSKSLSNTPLNRYKFNNGTEINEKFDINLYETIFRTLDPQLGKFWQIDQNFPNRNEISKVFAHSWLIVSLKFSSIFFPSCFSKSDA